MSPTIIFLLHLPFGYVPWLLCVAIYFLPWLEAMDRDRAQRILAAVNSFRFFGLVFMLPGVVGPDLPGGFAAFAAYGDFATGLLAMLALASFRLRPLFWVFVVAFNVVGAGDIILDYYHGASSGLPALAGQLGGAYAIVMIYVPLLMISHAVALYLFVRRPSAAAPRRERPTRATP